MELPKNTSDAWSGGPSIAAVGPTEAPAAWCVVEMDTGMHLRRPFTHVDFVAKSHNFWRCQRRVFTPKKSIPIFRPTTPVFSSWGPTT